jgi:hypothetical protein
MLHQALSRSAGHFVVQRQPVRIVDGRIQGGYTGVFELICPGWDFGGREPASARPAGPA